MRTARLPVLLIASLSAAGAAAPREALVFVESGEMLVGGLVSARAARAPWDALTPTTTPRVFFPGVVSRKGVVQFNNAFRDDGELLAYTLTGKDVPGYVVTQRWTGEDFEEPVRLPLDRQSVHSDPFLSSDGDRMLFASTLPLPGSAEGEGFHLWQVTRAAGGWSAAQPVAMADEPVGGKGYPSLTADGILYFSSKPEGTRNSDIYRAVPTKNGYAAPERLPAPVNTDRFEGDAYVDRRERFVIFAAFDREGGLGESDLHIAFRCGNEWTEPASLGPEVNSAGFDGSPWVTPDGRYLIFTSSRPTDDSGEQDFFNVYYVSLDLPKLAPGCAEE